MNLNMSEKSAPLPLVIFREKPPSLVQYNNKVTTYCGVCK